MEIDDDRLLHGRIDKFSVKILGSNVDDHELDSSERVLSNMGLSEWQFKRSSSR